MPDEIQTGDNGVMPEPVDSTPKNDLPDWVRDPERAYTVIRDLRKEAENNRKALADLKKQFETVQQPAAIDPKIADDLAKTRQELADLQKRLQEKESNELRMKIAGEFGLPLAVADRLKGDNEEALRKDAEALKALIPAQQPATTSQNTARVPGGAPVGETDEQKRARLLGGNRGNNPIFNKRT